MKWKISINLYNLLTLHINLVSFKIFVLLKLDFSTKIEDSLKTAMLISPLLLHEDKQLTRNQILFIEGNSGEAHPSKLYKYNKVTLVIPQSTPVEHIFVGNVSAMYLSKGCRSLTGLQARRLNTFLENRGGKKSWFPDHLFIFTKHKGINRIGKFRIFF